MNQRSRIGELLSSIVPLSTLDVEEILQEQLATHRRFGEIALAWGLCQPEHVWNAWCQQLAQGVTCIDLHQVGIDVQAVGMVPREVARELEILPVRIAEDVIIIATAAPSTEALETELTRRGFTKIMLVRAERPALLEMLDVYYPASQPA
jgi:hypothetical protein